MKSIAGESNNNAAGTNGNNDNTGGVDQPPPPEFLVNQDLTFDNKVVANQLLETIWSVGSDDIFYYETDYMATYVSTLVTITGQNSIPVLTVRADNCDAGKNLNEEESRTLSSFFANYIDTTEIRAPRTEVEVQTPGCAFPRLALDAKGLLTDQSSNPGGPAVDFDIYFATPECAPSGEFHVTDRNGNDPAAALDEVRTFFRAQIDELCL